MSDAGKEGINLLGRVFDSVERRFGGRLLEPKVLYIYPKQGVPTLWVDLLRKENGVFKPWQYSINLSTESQNIRTIPESDERAVIHFFPPEAVEAYQRQTEEVTWLEDPLLRGKNVGIVRRNIVAFTDFLKAIQEDRLREVDYIIGETNYIMIKTLLGLGFKRCWEDGYSPSDLTRPITDEYADYKFGIAIPELVEMYGLDKQVPTKESVLETVRSNRKRNTP